MSKDEPDDKPEHILIEQDETEVETHASGCATFFIPAVIVFVVGLLGALYFFASRAL